MFWITKPKFNNKINYNMISEDYHLDIKFNSWNRMVIINKY